MHINKKLLALVLFFATSTSMARYDQLIVDQYFSPYSGTSVNLSLFHTYEFLDDYYLPSSAGKATFLWGVGRCGKLVIEDWISQFLMVLQHEFFGHGYRLREFHFSHISYYVNIGHGATGFSEAEFDALPLTKQAAVSAAGMEANAVLSQQIRQNWITQHHIDHRDAMLYFITSLDQADYIWVTSDESTKQSNDVNSYVAEVNAWYNNTSLTKRKLRTYAFWDLLDPSLYMGLYSIGKYIYNGAPGIPMYMFNIKDYKYMFAARLLMAPYGAEFQWRNYVMTAKQQLWQINLRYGNNSHIQSYGLDILTSPIWRYKQWDFGNKLYLWRQPKFLTQNIAAGVHNGLGFAEFVSAEYRVNHWFGLLGELGYKTAGYIQGIPLGNSWVWRVGMSLTY